jgi:hypothetical protein
MDKQQKKILDFFHFRRILIPIILGLGVASFLLWRSFDLEAFREVNWGGRSYVYIGMALLMMVIRDGAYMIRLRVLTDGQLSWRQSFEVIMLGCLLGSDASIIGGRPLPFLSSIAKGSAWVVPRPLCWLRICSTSCFTADVPLILWWWGQQTCPSVGSMCFCTPALAPGHFCLDTCLVWCCQPFIPVRGFYQPKGHQIFCAVHIWASFLRAGGLLPRDGQRVTSLRVKMKGSLLSSGLSILQHRLFVTARLWVVNFAHL